MDTHLQHHGIKGMKWGVRKDKTVYGDTDDSVIKKGTNLGRVSISKDDRTYDNKKYVSYTKSDHEQWEKYLGEGYRHTGRDTYNVMYKTTKDIKVASATQSGKRFVDEFLSTNKQSQAIADTNKALSILGQDPNTVYTNKGLDASKMAALNMAAQTETGKQYVQSLINDGYGAVADYHGRNTSYDPLIILDPDNKLKKTSVSRTRY